MHTYMFIPVHMCTCMCYSIYSTIKACWCADKSYTHTHTHKHSLEAFVFGAMPKCLPAITTYIHIHTHTYSLEAFVLGALSKWLATITTYPLQVGICTSMYMYAPKYVCNLCAYAWLSLFISLCVHVYKHT